MNRALVIAMLLTTTLIASPLAAASATSQRRGAFAFHYAPELTAEELAWYSKFDLLVTHDPLPPRQVRFLHEHGTKLVLYEWAVAFYGSLAPKGSWKRRLLERHPRALLNIDGLRGGAGSAEADAFYFDPATPEHRNERPLEIARRLAAIGYDGIFLDTTTVENVHAAARSEFERRHPSASYDFEYSRFMKELRKQLRGGIIFTNQGYRSPADYLPFCDWDLSESLVTHPRFADYAARPWNDPADPWNSIQFIFTRIIEPVQRSYPNVRFAHLNYVREGDPAIAQLVVATARIFDSDGFVAARDVREEESELYFVDVGSPTAPRVDTASASYRIFTNGIAAVNGGAEPLRLTLPEGHFADASSGECLSPGDWLIPPASNGVPTARIAVRVSAP